jgi:GxxExxY protein
MTPQEYALLSPGEERIAKQIVDSAYRVHVQIGPGLLESVYKTCFCYELKKRGLNVQTEVPVPIFYDGHELEGGLRLDVLVEGQIICELKAVAEIHPVFQAQILSYLKLTKRRLGFLINFNVPVIREGIQRIIL